MTYNIDIINLCINHYANNIKISKIASILNISIMNIYLWIKKYNYFFLIIYSLRKKIITILKILNLMDLLKFIYTKLKYVIMLIIIMVVL